MSLNANRLICKRKKLSEISATANMAHTSAMCIQETWNMDEFKSVETHIPGFVEHRSNRKNRMGGGTAIYVRDEYTVVKSEKFSNGIVECQLVKIEELHLSLVNIYRPPGSDISSFREALDKLSTWLEDDRYKLVMMGDFNLPEAGSWSEIETLHIRETAAKREGGL